jgi:hypothetical protein
LWDAAGDSLTLYALSKYGMHTTTTIGATRGGPSSSQGYSNEYPIFLAKNYTYIVHSRYTYEKRKEKKEYNTLFSQNTLRNSTMQHGPSNLAQLALSPP